MSIKAFELVPAIERLQLMSEKSRTEIECIECCGKNLYIGTSDCFVVHYVLEEKILPSGKVMFASEKQGHKYLGVKKPIAKLKAASALNRILVLCDNTLTLLNMFDLEPVVGGAKIKGVTTFGLNDNPMKSNPFSVEICVAFKKKQVQLYMVTEDKFSAIRDMALPEPPLALAIDGVHACVAMATKYDMINTETGQILDLFPYDEKTTPLVTRITKEEFLLSAPSALGMFATAGGISQRPPLQWSDNLVAVAYTHPYILALNDEFITVHSILDQQQKQSIPFHGGQSMGEFDGRLFVASGKEVYSLVPVALDKQIQSLLADRRVAEALDLAKNVRKTGISKEKFIKMFRRIQQQAGFIEFSQLRFDDARELFKSSFLDVRELISLYPSLMPTSTNFTRAVPPLHEIADINQLAKGDQDVVQQYKSFLLPYLEEIRGTRDAIGCQVEIDTSLLKLYAEFGSPELSSLITPDSACDVSDCVSWLERYNCHHALALLYRCHGDNDKSLNVWIRIDKGEIQDTSFPGKDFVIEFLANLKEHDLVWKYAEWSLEGDEERGVKIFSERPEDDPQTERMRPDHVVDYLGRYPRAVVIYLEYLIFTRKLEKEKFHTHLAVLYLDHVLQLMKTPETDKQELEVARSKLRQMLQVSNLYRVQLLLGKVKETNMHAEAAILYGKLEEHDKALRILVHRLRDYVAAENYCIVNAKGKDAAYEKRLFQLLLGVYLDPSHERRDALVAPAVSLLNNNRSHFDTVKVLQMLPDNWSIGLLSGFLTQSVRGSLDDSRTIHIERMLARGENLSTKQINIAMRKHSVNMTEDKLCAVCSRGFTESSFVRYPNGVVTHIQCAKNKNVCPITGKLFNATSASSNNTKQLGVK